MMKILIILTLGVLLFSCAPQQNKDQQLPSQIDTSTWKTYVNEVNGWEIHFPENYKCPERQFGPCKDKSERVRIGNLRLYSEDMIYDGALPTFSFEIEDLKQKPSEQDFFDYINLQAMSEANNKPNIKILKIHDTVILNEHKMVKVETIQE